MPIPGRMVSLTLHWQALRRPSNQDASSEVESNFYTTSHHGTTAQERSHPSREGKG